MNLTHPASITACEIIIDGYNMNALSLQRIQICRECGYQRLTFTSLHLCNTSLMKDHTTDQLYPVMLHTKYTLCCLSDSCKCLWKKIIQSLSCCQSLLVFFCLIFQFLIGQRLHSRTQCFDLVNGGSNQFQFSLTVSTEQFVDNIHILLLSIYIDPGKIPFFLPHAPIIA